MGEELRLSVQATFLSGAEAASLSLMPSVTLGQVRGELTAKLGRQNCYKLVTSSGVVLESTNDNEAFAHLLQIGVAESFEDPGSPKNTPAAVTGSRVIPVIAVAV